MDGWIGSVGQDRMAMVIWWMGRWMGGWMHR